MLQRCHSVALSLQQKTLQQEIDTGQVKIQGNEEKLVDLLGTLDTFDFWFNIVTPYEKAQIGINITKCFTIFQNPFILVVNHFFLRRKSGKKSCADQPKIYILINKFNTLYKKSFIIYIRNRWQKLKYFIN